MKNNIGIIGLSTMGGNLARNMANKGFKVSVFNRTYLKTEDLLSTHEELDLNCIGKLFGYKKLEDFVKSLELPRKIIILVKAGEAVGNFIEELKPLLTKNDIVIDSGNSQWQDTIVREMILEGGEGYSEFEDEFENKNIYFVGCGISGGAVGALYGPSIMLGGKSEAVSKIKPMFEKIAAKDAEGLPCVASLGSNPSGHFVKMVHNGIEYAIMQGISEIYLILKQMGMDNEESKAIIDQLNTGYNNSYLLDITTKVLVAKTDNKFLLNLVEGQSKSKGTGLWAVQSALELGVSVPNIYTAVNQRLSSLDANNFIVNKLETAVAEKSFDLGLDQLKTYLDIIFLTSYVQGLELILAAQTEHSWGIEIEEVLRVWQGGCIIRSGWLEFLPKLLSNSEMYNQELQSVLEKSINLQLYLNQNYSSSNNAVFDSSISYLKGLLYGINGQNLIQAQRDYFGQHGYNRTDRKGNFTGGW